MAMDEDRFWGIIESARSENELMDGDAQDLVDQLQQELEELEDNDIAEFQQQMLVQYCRAFNYLVIGATYVIVGDECDEDDLHGFRGWLIAQGKETFEQAIENPEFLADEPITRDMVYLPDIVSIGSTVYEQSTGDLPPADPEFEMPSEPLGEEIPYEELPKSLPELCAEWGFESIEEDEDDVVDPVQATLDQLSGDDDED